MVGVVTEYVVGVVTGVVVFVQPPLQLVMVTVLVVNVVYVLPLVVEVTGQVVTLVYVV